VGRDDGVPRPRDLVHATLTAIDTHFCSGHAFARALERIALRVLLEEAPTIALVPDDETLFAGFEFRAPRRMPVAWQRAAE
jgi:cytochrome P450